MFLLGDIPARLSNAAEYWGLGSSLCRLVPSHPSLQAAITQLYTHPNLPPFRPPLSKPPTPASLNWPPSWLRSGNQHGQASECPCAALPDSEVSSSLPYSTLATLLGQHKRIVPAQNYQKLSSRSETIQLQS